MLPWLFKKKIKKYSSNCNNFKIIFVGFLGNFGCSVLLLFLRFRIINSRVFIIIIGNAVISKDRIFKNFISVVFFSCDAHIVTYTRLRLDSCTWFTTYLRVPERIHCKWRAGTSQWVISWLPGTDARHSTKGLISSVRRTKRCAASTRKPFVPPCRDVGWPSRRLKCEELNYYNITDVKYRVHSCGSGQNIWRLE